MSILSNFDAVPNRVRALARLIAASGPLEREEAQARMIPIGEGNAFSGLVRETVRLGLLQEDGKIVRLAAGLKKKDVADNNWFVNFIDSKLFSEELGQDHDNRPVALALAWLLTKKPGYEVQWRGEHNTTIRADLTGDDIYDVTNRDRAAMLAYWARFTGYAEASSHGGVKLIVPDPTNAIARRLPQLFQSKNEIQVGSFLTQLAKLCPVLEGGTIRAQVEARLKRQRDDAALSPATSLALLRLKRRGTLNWDAPSDANIVYLDILGAKPERVSHIRWKGHS